MGKTYAITFATKMKNKENMRKNDAKGSHTVWFFQTNIEIK